MKKMLMLASTASMILQFNMQNISLLQDMGYAVDVACNFNDGNTCSDSAINDLKNKLNEINVPYYQVDFSRDIKKIRRNYKALNQVRHLLKNNNYSFLHCHTPIGGVIGRIAGKIEKTKVVYTVHGFHFFKGAPIRNWIMYYPVEWICAHWTDVLITINKEDYALARKKMKAKKIFYVPGVGIDLKKFDNQFVDKVTKRNELGIPQEAVLLLSVGELNENKNHETIIRALAKLNKEQLFYVIVGKGKKRERLEKIAAKKKLNDRIIFLGYRDDIKELLGSADIFVFPSFREGLGLSALEAMASGLPLITSNIHGINDYSVDGQSGYKCDPNDINGFARCIEKLSNSKYDRIRFGKANIENVKKFSVELSLEKMKKIYGEML